jgi:lipase (class 3)
MSGAQGKGQMRITFDLAQTALAFAFAAGRAENIWGTQSTITDFFDKALRDGGSWTGIYGPAQPADNQAPTTMQVTGFLKTVGSKLTAGSWQIAWGPCVYADPLASAATTTLANGMFVAYSHSDDAYIVAVSPTNFASLRFVVEKEDFESSPDRMVDAPIDLTTSTFRPSGNDTSHIQLTGGTGLGLHILCTQLRDADGVGIADFLKTALRTPNTRLIFAGHSLGAALAPALAYQLLEGLEQAGWNRRNVSVFATAGATPGNQKFCDDWALKFPARGIQGVAANNTFKEFNRLYWNRFDIVPYGFANLHGQGDLDWNSHWPVLESDTVVCKIGKSVDDKNKTENNLAFVTQGNARTCQLAKLTNTRFEGRFPVRYWVSDGYRTYEAFPTGDMNADQYLFAKGIAHMGQYLLAAGIDPLQIPPPVGFAG